MSARITSSKLGSSSSQKFLRMFLGSWLAHIHMIYWFMSGEFRHCQCKIESEETFVVFLFLFCEAFLSGAAVGGAGFISSLSGLALVEWLRWWPWWTPCRHSTVDDWWCSHSDVLIQPMPQELSKKQVGTIWGCELLYKREQRSRLGTGPRLGPARGPFTSQNAHDGLPSIGINFWPVPPFACYPRKSVYKLPVACGPRYAGHPILAFWTFQYGRFERSWQPLIHFPQDREKGLLFAYLQSFWWITVCPLSVHNLSFLMWLFFHYSTVYTL